MKNIIVEKKKKRKAEEASAVSSDILRYGSDILQSDVFRRADDETHHLHGSVSGHTLNVCIASVRLCRRLQRTHMQLSEKDLIQAALCHDLGMVDRENRYHGRMDSWQSHPEESVKVARELVPDMSEEAGEMIRTHMWPVSGPCPRSKEGVLLSVADKYASVLDWMTWMTNRKYGSRIKQNLAAVPKQMPV